MYQIRRSVELVLLVSIFPVAMTQIRNPDSFNIPAGDIENALRLAFAQSTGRNSLRPQIGPASAAEEARPPPVAEAEADYDSFDLPATEATTEETDKPGVDLEGISLSHFDFRLTQPAQVQDNICVGNATLILSLILKEQNGWSPAEAIRILPTIQLNEDICLKLQEESKLDCPIFKKSVNSKVSGTVCNSTAPYRTLDGSCNNLDKPEWGASKRPFSRRLQPDYEDGLNKMRGEGRTIPLPSARTVSAGLQGITQKSPREDVTQLVMQWGQFLDHDLTHTPESILFDENNTPSPMGCCEEGDPRLSSGDPNCRPIDVSDDPLYQEKERQCMRFVRSLVASKGCTTGSLGPREQLNQLTSYLDASQVYGSDDEEAEGLRSKIGGLLRYSQPLTVGHGTFLPRHNCNAEYSKNKQDCFEAGDVRVNEQPALTSMHTLWLRVHNNIAEELAFLNHSWNDETLYQETRRIVAALHQQITYHEFLPIVHGPEELRKYQLDLQDQGYDNSYNSSVDATIVNVFATAAFRYGHTLVDELFKGKGHNLTLRGNFNEPFVLDHPSTSPSALLQGLTTCPTPGSDAFLTPTLVNHLLSKITDPIGFDLMALNIQRGRDHGLPPYHEWHSDCGYSPVNSFEDLGKIMDPDAVMVFKESYQSVQDIDLFPAGLAENPVQGGIIGPTLSCLISQQFQALKTGDRFWYENENQPKPFTTGQLSALREQSLASIMCQHLRLDSLQPMVFRSERLPGNQLQDCSTFQKLNLTLWSQNPVIPLRVCVSVGAWQELPGMNQWCINNCLHSDPPHCPITHCSCTG